MDRERVVVAEILRPRGNRGEVVARSQTDVPGRLETLKEAQVRLSTGTDLPVQIEEAWQHGGDFVLKFAGVDSIDGAEQFRNSDLWVPLADRAHLPDGEFFQADLVGCAVFDLASCETIGVVTGWQQFGGPPLLEVNAAGREVLIPFVKPIYQDVNLGTHVITVDLPEGLLDLGS